jgi:CDP-paratose 2-epimerase
MSVALVTGSGGLIGSEAVTFLAAKGLDVLGIDNDMRKVYFGADASTAWRVAELQRRVPTYRHASIDIRDTERINSIFRDLGGELKAVIHCAGQPSHDWSARDTYTDFSVNAVGTLTLLEAARNNAPEAAFVFLSTNKVYGDTPNSLPLVELETRWEVDSKHRFFSLGIDESMSVDHSLHSPFGVSKLAADLIVQEYGRYFGLRTACFRCGCLTGGSHSGAELHGFLSYLMMCTVAGRPYTVYGYNGKQVRDNIHAFDVVSAAWQFVANPKSAAVYNIGGGRTASCSVLEAIHSCEKIADRGLDWQYSDASRLGDHMWWITDTSAFRDAHPNWSPRYSLPEIFEDLHDQGKARWRND